MKRSIKAVSLLGEMLVFFLATVTYSSPHVAAIEPCQTNLKTNLDSLVMVTVADKQKLKTNRFNIVLNEGETFNNILTPECPKDNFPKLSVKFRMEGTEDWSYEYPIEGISRIRRNQRKLVKGRKVGKIRLIHYEELYNSTGLTNFVSVSEELDYCKVYEMKLKVNNDNYTEEVIKFGPLKESFTQEELMALDEEVDEPKEIDLTFIQSNDELSISWDFICAESVKIYLSIAGGMSKLIQTETSLSKTNFNNSVTIPTKPCTQYDLELETYLSSDPSQKDYKYGALYTENKPFITDPDQETFGNIKMDKASKILSWDFSKYLGFDKEYTICIYINHFKYKITLGTIEGEELIVLMESSRPDGDMTLDVLQAIEDKKTTEFEKCHPYEIKMAVSYKTSSGKNLSRIFSRSFTTNRIGNFAKSKIKKPTLKLDGGSLKIEDAEENSRCNKEVYRIICWEILGFWAVNSKQTDHMTVNIPMMELNLAENSEYTCKAKIGYQIQASQPKFESEWSEALTFTTPGPKTTTQSYETTENPATQVPTFTTPGPKTTTQSYETTENPATQVPTFTTPEPKTTTQSYEITANPATQVPIDGSYCPKHCIF